MSKKMLKRSLALGALMAFVITGSAMAAKANPELIVGNELDDSVNISSPNQSYTGFHMGGTEKDPVTLSTSRVYFFDVQNSGTSVVNGLDIKDCVIEYINRTDNQNSNHRGTVIHKATNTSLTIDNSIIRNNINKEMSGGRGYGVISSEGGTVTITNSDFIGNETTDMGGAMYVHGTTVTEITNSSFENNIADEGGALCTNSLNSTIVKDSDFISNTAKVSGGALNLQSRYLKLEGTNKFKNNSAGDKGGAIVVFSGGELEVDGTATFTGNKAKDVPNDIHNDGTVTINKGAVVTLNGGMDGTGTTKVDGILALGNNSNMGALAGDGGSIIKAESVTADVTLTVNNTKENTNTAINDSNINLTGVDLVINSNYTGAAYSGGVIKDTTIDSDSKVTINQNGEDHVIGQGNNTIKADSIELNAAAGAAIYLHKDDSATLEAKTIKMTSNFTQDMTEYNGSAAGIYVAGGNVYVKGFDMLDIDVTSDVASEGGHGIIANSGSVVSIIGSEGSNITVDAVGRGALTALGAGVLKIETGNLTAGTTALEGGTEIRKTSTIGAQGADSAVNLTATGNVTATAEEGMNAIGADAGASVLVSADGNVDIDGQVEGSGKSGGKRAEITVNGSNVSIDTVGEDAVRGFLSNITISADNELNVTSKDKDAIQSVVSQIELNAKTVNLTAGYDGWGINATGDAGNDITVNAENINVVGELGGIRNLAKSTIEVTTDNIMIDAGENEALRAVNQGVIEVNADKSAAVTGDITAATGGSVTINFEGAESFLDGAVTTDDTSNTVLGLNGGATWNVTGASKVSTLNSNEGKIVFASDDAHVDIDAGTASLTLTMADKTADDLNTATQLTTVAEKLGVSDEATKTVTAKVVMAEGEVKGETTGVVSYRPEEGEDGYFHGCVAEDTVTEKVNTKNQAIGEAGVSLKLHWRSHMNDMNKRMGELRNANGEHGVWTRMVRGESEYEGVKAQYNQYQLGYDEKLSVDKRWTVGAAVTFAEGDANYGNGTTEDKSTAFAIYGSKLNNDGTFVDLIARYANMESDFEDASSGKGDYSTNGMSVSAEFGKRIEQGNGLWIEPQVELTYGTVDSAEFQLGGKTVHVGDMDSLIGRVGFSLGKDIKQGNVYARASYLYDFDGETENAFSATGVTRTIEEDLGGGWWEVGVGANINLSKATYIYADIEKTFGGEVDTNWQWNLGVRYSF